jgi:hypothetical protein
MAARQQANLRRGGRRQRTTTKSLAHRDCDLLFFFASSESAAAAAVPLASLPSGARDLGAEEFGGFFRRTLASVRSVTESEFLLPVTKSRSDDNDDSELSLPRLFRPLQGHEDFCGGAGLLVSLAMAPPVIQRWLDSVVICIAVGFPATTPAGAASALALDGTDGTTRSAAACCRAGYRSFSRTSFVGFAACVVPRFGLKFCRVGFLRSECGWMKSQTSIWWVKPAFELF